MAKQIICLASCIDLIQGERDICNFLMEITVYVLRVIANFIDLFIIFDITTIFWSNKKLIIIYWYVYIYYIWMNAFIKICSSFKLKTFRLKLTFKIFFNLSQKKMSLKILRWPLSPLMTSEVILNFIKNLHLHVSINRFF